MKKLIGYGLTKEQANQKFDEIIFAETTDQVNDALHDINNKIIENNEVLFEDNKLQLLTKNDFANIKNTLNEEQIEEIGNTFADIKDDFIAGINGDVEAQKDIMYGLKTIRICNTLIF